MGREFLRHFIAGQNPSSIGLSVETVGLHSIRATAAMAMYMSGVPLRTIQLQGRWRSEAFMEYIRKQVDMFSVDVAKRMLSITKFNTITAQRIQAINNTNPSPTPALVTTTIPLTGISHDSSLDLGRVWGV
ncbi:hypothetical protein MPSEU_000957000 [Mayamaea pseudoterrestris]|nr:hypothetical protein MPSEU_000957000 [Mayamaea pseudoterrestris]